MYLFSKYDRFMVTYFLEISAIYAAWVARATFFFKGACLFKKSFFKGAHILLQIQLIVYFEYLN